MGTTRLSAIEVRDNRSGQPRAYIAGTRTRVQDIYVLSEIRGLLPEQIVAALPHLTLGQVHAALSYYWDHRADIRRELDEDQQFVAEVQRHVGAGPLQRKLSGHDAGSNQVSS